LLLSIGFVKQGEKFVKEFSSLGVKMAADFAENKLIYPETIKGGDRNTNFYKDNGQENKENFVVFECVNRLLEKGYRPEDIELEKVWSLGHNAKSGRADICVTDKDGSMLFIIECKTYGKEWDKAFADTNNDGAQLFSYWQQEQATKWLVLYASDFTDEKVLRYNAPTINCTDDANIILLSEKDKSIQLYKNAHTADEKHNVWKRTYESAWQKDLIFGEDTVAYKIGVKPLLKKDLLDFTPEDKIVNRFEEILRHNNVSDKENAFNRLTALFICKLVDEINKNNDNEVEFQYKQGTDTYETLQDRLQRLHRDGMDQFMKEKIFYVDSHYPRKLFADYTGSSRERAIADLEKTIRSLKFYSNNDFAFKDVHNEELFYQNGKILVEMVQLFEKYRIVYNGKHQFLGDLFEQLLNKGFKQDEGQFFTPTPITRFIWDCLPVKNLLDTKKGDSYPKIIDYACGAGHFLTEAVEAINYFANNNGDNGWVRDHIYGIEKDYRLARVAKIALYMNGAGEGNIIFGDGLENTTDGRIQNGMFDILVANPPYSVKDFKQHLQLKNNEFELLKVIGDNGSEIETLLVERIAQLLKPNGVAAVILPSSILSNNSNSYIGAREQILRNFNIRGIVSLGSKAFGATGTNTVIMFLEKYDEPPKKIDLLIDSVNAIFSGKDLSDWKDENLLEGYCSQIEVDNDNYKRFLNMELNVGELSEQEYFKAYVNAFNESAQWKDLQKKVTFKRKSDKEQQADYFQRLYKFIFEVEREKLLYFALVHKQRTVIIKSPVENKEQTRFLGYEWSNRKGNEGIIIHEPAGGMMYNNADRSSVKTLAAAVRASFADNKVLFIGKQQNLAAYVDTKNILDFSRAGFNKAIALKFNNKNDRIISRYPMKALGEICDVTIGGTPSRKNAGYFMGDNLWVSIAEMQGEYIYDTKEKITAEAIANSNVKLIPQGTTLLSFKLSIGKTAIAGRDLFTNEAIAGLIIRDKDKLLDKYLFYVFKSNVIDLENVGNKAFGKSLNSQFLREDVKVPMPPIAVQQEIIEKCEKIDEEYKNTRMKIDEYRKKIGELFEKLEIMFKAGGLKLSDLIDWVYEKTTSKYLTSNQYVTTDTMLQDCRGIRLFNGQLPNANVTVFKKDDILLSNIRPYLKKIWLAEFDGACSNDVLVMRNKDTTKCSTEFLINLLKRQAFFDFVMQDVNGAKMPRGKKNHIMDYKVYIPDIKVQKTMLRQVEAMEGEIAACQTRLNELYSKTSEIVKSYLM